MDLRCKSAGWQAAYLPTQGERQSFVLIEGSQGENLLLAGSPGDDSLVALLSDRMPLFSKRIDAIIIPDCRGGAQLKGLFQVVQKYEVDQVFWVCNHENNQTSRNLYALIEERDITQQRVTESFILQNENFSVNLGIDEGSNLTLRIEYGDTVLLFLPNKEDGFEEEYPRIASTGIDQDQGFSLFADCQNCQVEEQSTRKGNVMPEKHPSWKEIISNGQFLSIFVQ